MNFKIRHHIFETNSSSTHTLCICSDEEGSDWEEGDLYFDTEEENFCTAEQAKEIDPDFPYESPRFSKCGPGGECYDNKEQGYVDVRFITMEEFFGDCYFSTYRREYLTPKKGEKIHVFGYYGYDG